MLNNFDFCTLLTKGNIVKTQTYCKISQLIR